MITPMSDEEFLEISNEISCYHKIFFVFIELASISFDDTVPTACVRFPRQGKAEMLLGKDFWKDLTLQEKMFVVCHECLHVMLDHGVRNGMLVPGATHELVNIAQDITINEMIVDLFNYDRNDLRNWEKYCWIDTCFKDNHQFIKRNENFLYYLEELIKNPPPNTGEEGPSTLDEHGTGAPGEESQENKKAREGIAEALAEELSTEEIEQILKALPESIKDSGLMAGILEYIIAKKINRLKIKFSHIVSKLKKSCMKEIDVDVETFTHDDRRFGEVLARKDIALPGKATLSKLKQDRLLTAVFMDISGSCLDYIPTFEDVFQAFDREVELFETRLFIFDTKVTEVRPGHQVQIGGGTLFDIIETKCQELEAEVGRYPDCVVVITDGDGNRVEPKAPTKWIFLLTPEDSTDKFVPRNSRKFYINQITF